MVPPDSPVTLQEPHGTPRQPCNGSGCLDPCIMHDRMAPLVLTDPIYTLRLSGDRDHIQHSLQGWGLRVSLGLLQYFSLKN